MIKLDKVNDMDGWPMHEGTRIYVPRRNTSLLPEGWRDSGGRKALSGVGGVVSFVYETEFGDECVAFVDLDSGCRRDVRACQCRVQGGDNNASRAFKMDKAACDAQVKGKLRIKRK